LEHLSLGSLLCLLLLRAGLGSLSGPGSFSSLCRLSRLERFCGFSGGNSRGTLGTLFKQPIGFPDRDVSCQVLKHRLRPFAIATSHAPRKQIIDIGELPSIFCTPSGKGFQRFQLPAYGRGVNQLTIRESYGRWYLLDSS